MTPDRNALPTAAATALALSVLLAAAAQLFVKSGAETLPADLSWQNSLAILAALRSGWVWLGIVATVASLLAWLRALRTVPLNIAFNVAALSQVLVPLASWMLFGEQIGLLRGLGIATVFLGVLIIARPLVHAEEQL